MSINQTQDLIIEEFSSLPHWTDKYEYLIDLGKKLEIIDKHYKTEAYLIHGCQSQVWLRAEIMDNNLKFTADSDAIITKGLISLLIRVLTEQPPEDIANAELYFIDAIGLSEHLSSTRANGLRNMVDTLKSLGVKYSKIH